MADEPKPPTVAVPLRPASRVPSAVQWSKPPAAGDARPPAPPPTTPSAATVNPTVRAAQARAVAAVGLVDGKPALPSEVAAVQIRAASAGQSVAAAPAPAPAPSKDVEPDFFPLEPRDWTDSGIDQSTVEFLLLRYMLGSKAETGSNISKALGLPLTLIRDVLDKAKDRKLVNYRGTTVVGDFVTELTDAGRDKALESRKLTSYVGVAPVPWDHYVEALKYQSMTLKDPGVADLQRAFADLYVSEELFERLGPGP